MTATHVYVHADRVSILTDGASYDRNGVVLGFTNKTVVFPHLNAALTANAPTFFLPLLAARICDAFTTFDELITGIIERVRMSVAADQSFFDQLGDASFFLYIAGISETRGPEAYLLVNQSADEFRAWCLEPLSMGIIKPGDSDFFAEAFTMEGIPLDMESFDPAVHGLRILREQRMRPWEIVATGQKRHVIGGFAQLTTITRDAVETRILQRWSDRVGETINPARTALSLDAHGPLTVNRWHIPCNSLQ